MNRRTLGLVLALLTVLLVACQPPREFPPGVTDVELWEPYDIRPDTEVPDQYPEGRSGLAGADRHLGTEETGQEAGNSAGDEAGDETGEEGDAADH